MDWSPLLFAFHGFLGALLHLLVWVVAGEKKLSELKSDRGVAMLIVGAVIGYVYYWLHSEYSFPNAVMAVIVGYSGRDVIEALFEVLKKRIVQY